MKQKDSHGILTAPLLLFASTVLAVFFLSKFIETGRYIWLILFTLLLFFFFGALIDTAITLKNWNAKEVFFSRDDLEGKRKIGVLSGIAAAVVFILFSGNLADTEYDYIVNGIRFGDVTENFLGKIAGGLISGVIVYLLVMGIVALVLFLHDAVQLRAKKTVLLVVAVLAALVGGVLLGRALSAFSIRQPVIPQDEFLADPGAVRKGALVEFGAYPQNGTDPEPIVWRVIEKTDGELTLMSEYGLDVSYYAMDEGQKCTYPDSALRTFVTGPFLSTAFAAEERARLLPQPVRADEEDSVTVLTLSQANRVFGETAECPATENVKQKLSVNGRGDCEFFLRSDDQDDTDVYYFRFMEFSAPRKMSFSFDIVTAAPTLLVERLSVSLRVMTIGQIMAFIFALLSQGAQRQSQS